MGFLKYGEMHNYLVIYGEAFSHIRLCTRSLPNFLIYEENFVFFPFSAVATTVPVKDDFALVS
jgi:hypothetical protein